MRKEEGLKTDRKLVRKKEGPRAQREILHESLTSCRIIWNNRRISRGSTIRLMHFLVASIFLYACEPWTFTAEPQRRIRAMEMRCYRKILSISYKDHVTKEEVCAKIQQAIGPNEDILTNVETQTELVWTRLPFHQVSPKSFCKAQ